MTGEQLRATREKLKLTPTQAAASINRSTRTWQRWENQKEKQVPDAEARLFRILHKLEKV